MQNFSPHPTLKCYLYQLRQEVFTKADIKFQQLKYVEYLAYTVSDLVAEDSDW